MNSETKICLGAKRKINPDSVLMLKSDANYTNVFLVDGTKFLSSITLGILEKRLKSFKFIRPNRSVLVNQQFIEALNANVYAENGPFIRLFDNTIIPIARRKTTSLLKEFKAN
jgi:two-component system LytT family response regulator